MLYVLPLGEILINHDISFHCYADDVQLYLPLRVDGQAALHPLLDCLADIKAWMGANFLNLNDSKTETIVFGKTSPAFSNDALGPLASTIRPSVRNLERVIHAFITSQLDYCNAVTTPARWGKGK